VVAVGSLCVRQAGRVDADAIAERFGVGRPLGEPVVAASGWGERNRVWRFETTVGVFAIKDTIAALLPEDVDEAFRIECLAHDAGIPSPAPVSSVTGSSVESVDGRWFRCHRWIDGNAKLNEDTTTDDAHAMGEVVAALHGLEIPAGPAPSGDCFGRDHWLLLARRRPRTAWARSIEDHIDDVEAAEVLGTAFRDGRTVGSHCDLNAHNVLFSAAGPVLVDWDAAGPASVTYERGSTATLWAQRRDGGLDGDVAVAFLRGYRDGGGRVDRHDPDALLLWLSGLAWWTERNVQIAIAQPSEHHDQLAAGLVDALARGVATVRQRQGFLTAVIARL